MTRVEISLPIPQESPELWTQWLDRLRGLILEGDETAHLRRNADVYCIILSVDAHRLPEVATDLANEGFLG